MKKKIILLIIIMFCVGCKNHDKKYIADSKKTISDSIITCTSTKKDDKNGYEMDEIQEFIYNSNDVLKSANIKIKLDLLSDKAKTNLNSIIDSYNEMKDIVNNDNNAAYKGMNMNTFLDDNYFEVSIYYNISSLNKDTLNNTEFKKYINKDLTFNSEIYKSDQQKKGSKCTTVYNSLT